MSRFDQKSVFTATIEKHKGIFYKVALAYCKDEEDRKDLVQEMILQVWNSYPRYNEQFKVSTWIYRISLNVAISWYRKNLVRNKHLIPIQENESVVSDPESERNSDQEIASLYRFINDLKELERAIMILYLEEKSYREISEILGISETNVATRISRIKVKLKERFQALED